MIISMGIYHVTELSVLFNEGLFKIILSAIGYLIYIYIYMNVCFVNDSLQKLITGLWLLEESLVGEGDLVVGHDGWRGCEGEV